MKLRSLYPIILAIFAIGSAVSQNAEELPVQVETDNQFPPERSELDGHIEDSETTAAEPTEITSGTTTVGDAKTAIANGDDDSPVEVTETTTESLVVDETETTVINDAEKEIDNEDYETTTVEPTQTTSGSTITVQTPPTSPAELQENENSDTTAAKLTDLTLSTMADEPADTTAVEVTQTTSESTITDAAVPVSIAEDEQATTTNESDTTIAEITEVTSESTVPDIAARLLANNDEQITDDEAGETTAAETTQTTEVEPVTNDEATATTALETSGPTSGPTTTDVVPSTLANDEQTTSEGSETTILEPSEPTMGTTVADVVAPILTTTDDLVTNNGISDTTIVEPTPTADSPCPKPCVCITEGDSSTYIVDCSGTDLTELPTAIDSKTTTLKLNNNKLTAIPKAISELKSLKVLNANDNLINELESGSISELPELVSLNLANNRFLEYPKELENSLNKLEELNLAGNELKASPEVLSKYNALHTVTLPEVSPEIVTKLCSSLKDTLISVCANTCEEHSFKCSEAHLLDVALPGMIPFIPEIIKVDTENSDDIPSSTETSSNTEAKLTSTTLLEDSDNSATEKVKTPLISEAPEIPPNQNTNENRITMPDISPNSKITDSPQLPQEPQHTGSRDNMSVNDFSLRTAVNNAPQEKVAVQNIVIDSPKEPTDNETDVKVGAKTTETTGGGGVDKSVIAVIVAGMIIIIAVITVKKNWSSIRKRFSSEQRPNERSGRNANGTTPEEVPLQDKSPV